MPELYKSTIEGDLHYYLKHGWTEEEINKYFPILDSLTDKEFLKLHELCSISMFRFGEPVDPEQAMYVLTNPNDTPKELLISSIKTLQLNKKES